MTVGERFDLDVDHGTRRETVKATRINRVFAYHRMSARFYEDTDRWVLTHIPTGLWVCRARSPQRLKPLARKLTKAFGVKRWQAAKSVKRDPWLREAKALIDAERRAWP
jgi:hypothetical protein